MNEQPPKSPERRAAEMRYRNRAFGPGPEGSEAHEKALAQSQSGVYRGGAKKSTMPLIELRPGRTRA